MSKKILALLFSDLHLNDLNRNICLNFIEKMKGDIIKYSPKYVFFLGDFFDSRNGLTEPVLNTARNIFQEIVNTNKKLICIPGNHDKFIETYEKNYIQIYDNLIYSLYNYSDKLLEDKITYLFFPYFEGVEFDNQLKKIILLAKKSKEKNDNEVILLGHYMYEQLPEKLTKYCDKIFLGHNHEKEDFPKGSYIGSCIQKGFSEDKYKGYTLLYDDLSTKQIVYENKEYITQIVDLNIFSEEELKIFILKFKEENPNKYLRIELRGFSKDITYIKEFCKENDINCISKISNEIVEGENNFLAFSELSENELVKQLDDFYEKQNISCEIRENLNNLI